MRAWGMAMPRPIARRAQRLAGEQRFQDRSRLEAQRRGGPPGDLIQELMLVLGGADR